MNRLPEPIIGQIGLLIGPLAEREAMLKIAAILALRGPVHVLDGGNGFDAFKVARHIRRQTPRLNEALDRILVARAFTCYQVITLFEQTPATRTPQLALDMLSTFSDESVSVEEGIRLLKLAVGHLRRLRHLGPVMVGIKPPPQPERHLFVEVVRQAADQVYIKESTAGATRSSTPTLF